MLFADDHERGRGRHNISPSRDQEKYSTGLIPLVVVLGPTAAGKTDLAIRLAERTNGEIVSADSRLLYRGMDIGTAKPSREQRKLVPHHLIDIADPDQTWSLALFQARANQAIEEITSRERLPFLVGGTGQYLRAITEAWKIPEIKPDRELRKALENWSLEIGPEGLHQRLKVLDPQAAARIDYQNVRRTTRAIEVIFRSGELFSSQRSQVKSHYRVIQIGLKVPRDVLYARIDARIDTMLKSGLVDEVKNLLDQGYAPDLPAFSAIGYQEIINHLQGKISLEEAVMLVKRRSRQFVRRQANWFKEDDPSIHWIDLGNADLEQLVANLENWLDSD